MNNNNKSKNPYELRFDIFHTAQQRAEQKWREDLEDYRVSRHMLADGKKAPSLERPSYPTLDEVFDEAQSIKEFVENKH
tara:strand:- start:299 stop:535 length:237 start_codon:yes stop_codon:yes gene_type:complete